MKQQLKIYAYLEAILLPTSGNNNEHWRTVMVVSMGFGVIFSVATIQIMTKKVRLQTFLSVGLIQTFNSQGAPSNLCQLV